MNEVQQKPSDNPFDFAIIGSGFGGSVAAMRLSQKGYRVAVIETGKRLHAHNFPKTNWRIRKYLWSPIIKCFGPQRISFLKGIMVLRGAGVGGGSLVYANTLMKPLSEIYRDGTWPEGFDWEKEMAPFFQTAGQMLGITPNPKLFEGEMALKALGERMGAGKTFHPTEVAVYFGKEGETVKDPYFSGAGPERTGCNFCGGCMEGCRYRAKNTLDLNYLYFAEKWGAQIFSETTVQRIVPNEDTYQIESFQSTSWFKFKRPTLMAKKVILSAGVLGTVELLLKNKETYKTLPHISDRLGQTVRTNGESLVASTTLDSHRDFSRGIAIGAAIHPDSITKIEACRYSSGSSVMRALAVPLTPNGSKLTRPLKLIWKIFSRFPRYIRMFLVRDWAKSSIILLVMQSIDRQMHLRLGRSIFHGFREGLKGAATEKPIPSFLPIGQEAIKLFSKEINGEAQNALSEVILGMPATAHILGGCCLANDRSKGVIDPNHEIFGHPGLYVCDGSVIPCNLGVNPSFTITALAERFADKFPVHSDLSSSEWEKRKIKFGPANGISLEKNKEEHCEQQST